MTYANEDGRREVLAREAAHLVAISENSDFCGNSAVGTFGTEGFAAFAGSDCLVFRVGRDWWPDRFALLPDTTRFSDLGLGEDESL